MPLGITSCLARECFKASAGVKRLILFFLSSNHRIGFNQKTSVLITMSNENIIGQWEMDEWLIP